MGVRRPKERCGDYLFFEDRAIVVTFELGIIIVYSENSEEIVFFLERAVSHLLEAHDQGSGEIDQPQQRTAYIRSDILATRAEGHTSVA